MKLNTNVGNIVAKQNELQSKNKPAVVTLSAAEQKKLRDENDNVIIEAARNKRAKNFQFAKSVMEGIETDATKKVAVLMGRDKLLSGDVISFETESLGDNVGKPIHLSDGPNQFSLLPEGQYSTATSCIFNVDKNGCLTKIVQKGNSTLTTVDPETQKQLWSKHQTKSAMTFNVAAKNTEKKSNPLQRWREQVMCKFTNGVVYPNTPFSFPNSKPTIGTSALDAAGNCLIDGSYQILKPVPGTAVIKNGLIASFTEVTATQKPAEQKLSEHTEQNQPKHVLSMVYTFADPSNKTKEEYFSEVDELDLPERAKEALRQKYLDSKKN